MKGNVAILLDVPAKKVPATTPTVPAEYGLMLIESGKKIGLTRDKLAAMAGVSDITAWRLETGRGSYTAARKLRRVLVEKGQKIPALTIDSEGADEDAAEWASLGEDLRRYAGREAYERVVDDIQRLIQAHQIVAGGISAISHPIRTDRDDDDRGGK